MVNYGIVGCGMMGREHIRNIALLPQGRVTAVYDPVEDLARTAADLAGGAQICATLAEMLALADLDALVIVSPNDLHVPQLKEIAETRHLPLLCEKPLYTAPEDEAFLRDFAKGYGAPVWVAMEYRYMPPIALLRDEVQEATGGVSMLTIREHRFPFLPKVGTWNRFNIRTGGTLVEKCCHFFDMMRLILQDEPVRVMASAGQAVNHKDETYDGRSPDIWDNGYVIVDFTRGARAMLELCMFAEGSRYQEVISAMGPHGKIEALVPGPGRFWPEHLGKAPVPKVIVSPRVPNGPREIEVPVAADLLAAGDHNGSTFYQHERFNAVLRGEGSPEVTLEDGMAAVRIGLAAQQSAATGQAVTL